MGKFEGGEYTSENPYFFRGKDTVSGDDLTGFLISI
jgi:hypothetical protein